MGREADSVRQKFGKDSDNAPPINVDVMGA